MDPFTAALSIGGLLMSGTGILGGVATAMKEANIASQEYQVSSDIAGFQMQENQRRRLAMQLNARRQSTQVLRQSQMARSRALATGVAQGAQFSSGVAGGQAQAESEGAYNLAGISENLQIGENLFALTGQIDQSKIKLAGLESQQATLQGTGSIFQGLSSFGSSLSGGAGNYGKVFQYLTGGTQNA